MSSQLNEQASSSSLLWSHILPLPSSRPPPLPRTHTAATIPVLAPSDKTGTTLRLLLQDTQSSLERFSGRLDKLFTSLETSKQSISTIVKLFEESQESTREDTRSIVHVAQSELQASLDKLTQQQTIDELKVQLLSDSSVLCTVESKVDRLEQKLSSGIDALNHRLDGLNGFVDKRLDALSLHIENIVSQQNQLLAALGAVATLSPLFRVMQVMPEHRDSAVSDVSAAVERVEKESTTSRQRRNQAPAGRTKKRDSSMLEASPKVLRSKKARRGETRSSSIPNVHTINSSDQTLVGADYGSTYSITCSDTSATLSQFATRSSNAASVPLATPHQPQCPKDHRVSKQAQRDDSGSISTPNAGYEARPATTCSNTDGNAFENLPFARTRASSGVPNSFEAMHPTINEALNPSSTLQRNVQSTNQAESLNGRYRVGKIVTQQTGDITGTSYRPDIFDHVPGTESLPPSDDLNLLSLPAASSSDLPNANANTVASSNDTHPSSSFSKAVDLDTCDMVAPILPTSDAPESFKNLNAAEEDEGNVSLDMDFIWGSLPDSSFEAD